MALPVPPTPGGRAAGALAGRRLAPSSRSPPRGIDQFKTWMAGHRRAEATPSFRRLCPAMTKSFSSPQQPLSRHMIELEPDAIGVFEQNRIISRRPLILARRADDFGVERAQK